MIKTKYVLYRDEIPVIKTKEDVKEIASRIQIESEFKFYLIEFDHGLKFLLHLKDNLEGTSGLLGAWGIDGAIDSLKGLEETPSHYKGKNRYEVILICSNYYHPLVPCLNADQNKTGMPHWNDASETFKFNNPDESPTRRQIYDAMVDYTAEIYKDGVSGDDCLIGFDDIKELFDFIKFEDPNNDELVDMLISEIKEEHRLDVDLNEIKEYYEKKFKVLNFQNNTQISKQ